MDDLATALEENRVKEMFGSGTACVVCPVSSILFKGQVRQIVLYPNLLPRAGEMAWWWRHLSSRLRTSVLVPGTHIAEGKRAAFEAYL